jgi:FAD/FMN-containing dehydrogenase
MLFPRAPAATAALVLAAAGLARADTCSQVAGTTSIEVRYPLDLAYISEQNDYWSTMCAALKPSCIIFPRSAEEMAAAVRILRENDEDFAVKSGGHSPNNYWSSVDGGPLLSTQRLDQVILDQETGVAQIGPGNRLDEVAKKLDGTGWTYVGGRIGNTGVGGLMVGGGLSYMSTQYGWAASAVISYEVVLANGTIVTASENENSDLYLALKGGGNNFGIITTYTLQTYPQGDVWGGNLFFAHSDKNAAALLKAVRDFTEYNPDPKAAVILTAERAGLDLVDSWIMFLFYDGPTPPEGIFSNFTDVGPILSTVRTRSYADLIAFSNWVVVPGEAISIATETVPNPPDSDDGIDMITSIWQHWRDVSTTQKLVPGVIASIAFQPFSRDIARQAIAAGGDLIDCEDGVDRIIIELNYHYTLHSDYPKIDGAMAETYGGIRSLVTGWQAAGAMEEMYLPVFANYAYEKQDYWARLRPESRAFARRVVQAYDPEGLFQSRTGGWKP